MENLDVRSSRYHYSKKVGVEGGRGGGVMGTPGPPLATPLVCMHNENEMKSKLRCTISSKSLSFLVNPSLESVPLFK